MNDKFFSDYCKEIRKDLGYSRDKAAELMGDTVLIIDAKYYGHTTQEQYGVHTLHSSNLYQVFTYVKKQGCRVWGSSLHRVGNAAVCTDG